MSREKRVILFLVEGTTDETVLIPPFKSLLEKEGEVYSEKFFCDVTTVRIHRENATFTIGQNSRDSVRNLVLEHLQRKPGYIARDIARIVHIVDTDGAFIPDQLVVADNSLRTKVYEADRIRTPDKNDIVRRNREKAAELKLLSNTTALTIGGRKIPYYVHYLSRNLEHALMGIVEECSQERKDRLAVALSDKISKKPELFVKLLNAISTKQNYRESWEYIARESNSLKRGSNLDLALPKTSQNPESAQSAPLKQEHTE